MQIDVQLLPIPVPASSLSRKTVVVIDVLRATSVIVQAISQGALEILPVITVEEAFRRGSTFPEGTVLLGGERGSRKIDGFDLGNSPKEYLPEKVRGKRIVLTTTNGTRAFYSVMSAKEVLAGAFFNIGAVARRCVATGDDLLIYPSGDTGRFSLEDVVCGGMLIHRILSLGEKAELTDAGQAALILYRRFEADLTEAFRLSIHGRDLIGRGFEEDLPFCARIDVTEVVPVFREGAIRPLG
ncbi:MAG: 2-phosphosulfolactate phosphatase [Desulfobacterota bacterium]|nr:2-phosphosulfolactate phosphatase [Thermodesulfobacteriota bacterium]